MFKKSARTLLRLTTLAVAATAVLASAAHAQTTTLRLSTYVNEVDIRFDGSWLHQGFRHLDTGGIQRA